MGRISGFRGEDFGLFDGKDFGLSLWSGDLGLSRGGFRAFLMEAFGLCRGEDFGLS